MPHLWESKEDNACCALSDALRLFEFHSWDLFLTAFGNKEFTGPLLWHYWSTPAADCEFCTDQAYCEEDSYQERYGNPVPSENNQLWLLRTLRAGNDC